MLVEKKIKDFLEETASKSPLVPSGGSVMSLCAALAAALTELTANVTVGKAGYENVEEEMKLAAQKALDFRKQFTKYMDDDANSYSGVVSAYKLPRNTEKEKLIRRGKIENNLKKSTLVPLKLAQDTFQILELIHTTLEKGNRNASGDAKAAEILARAVILSSLNNVKINLSLISDTNFSSQILKKVQSLENKLPNTWL